MVFGTIDVHYGLLRLLWPGSGASNFNLHPTVASLSSITEN